jgi:Cu(I)/Ag(I) efflux system membrane fusion protein
MSTTRKTLLGLGTVGFLILGAVFYAQAQTPAKVGEQSAHGQMNMPGMEMPAQPATTTSAAVSAPADYAEVAVAPAVQQRIGVTLDRAERTPLTMRIRTVGIVRPDETKVAHIHLKTEGWVEKLFVSFTGQKVKAGDSMLSIYSPAFFTAQREFLSALQAAKATPSPDQQIIVEAVRRRLELWDVPKDEIDALEQTGKPSKSLALRSPIAGTVLEKKAFEGQYIAPQDELYMVADLSTVWVQAKVFEYELPHIEIGMPVTVALPALPTKEFTGRVVFIDPVVEETARTVQVRIELPNPDGLLKPGMFGRVVISHKMGEGLTVPTSAIIRTGERDIAFRAVSTDRFVPVQVKISPLRFEDRFQVLEGLKAGDEVVTSANFLIDSESRLRAGGGSMAGMAGMDMGDTGGGKKPAAKPDKAKQPDDMKGMDMP